ncbi:MAG: asparagine synthase [Thaumarchaeota archaeon]|nr:asparagine synthase [Nitrososphaerota archaeon]
MTQAGSLQEICSKLQSLVSDAVAKHKTESISLSGGLDSSILASCLGKNTRAYAMVAQDFPSTDLVNAQLVSGMCGLKLDVIPTPVDKMLESVEQTIKILKVFNPIEIRNNIVVYTTIKQARKDGITSMMTGDGADELFAGYGFFQRMSALELKKDLERIWQVMHFPSRVISESVGIELHTPFLDRDVAEFAKSISPELKVREEKGKKYGKWVLRKAFEKSLPSSIVWREKAAMQDGAGTSGLTGFFDSMIPDSVFEEKAKKYLEKEQVILPSKESLHYYEIYRRYYDYPAKLESSKNRCPNCNYFVKEGSHFCRMCGSFPI